CLLSVAIAGFTPSRAGATDALWENHTIFRGVPPQIDAAAFLNTGLMELFVQTPATPGFTTYPFETLNTLNYTNRGIIDSRLGLRFDTHDNSSVRRPAANFVNSGEVIGTDNTVGGQTRSLIEINATNVFNRGLLDSGESGRMDVRGGNVDLQRSGLRVAASGRTEPDSATFSDFQGGGTHFNAPNITDFYWNIQTNAVDLFSDFIFREPNFRTPGHFVLTNLSGGVQVYLPGPTPVRAGEYPWATPPLATYSAFTATNRIGGTNIVIVSVFIPTEAANGRISSEVGFARLAPGTTTNELALAAPIPTIRIQVRVPDPTLDGFLTNSLYIEDFSLIQSNLLSTNVLNNLTRKPRVIRVSRTETEWWTNRRPANATYDNNSHLYSGFFSNQVVTVGASSYALSVNEGSLVLLTNLFNTAIPEATVVNTNPYLPVALFDPTNRPGRLELSAGSKLDLRKTRVFSQNYLKVASPHVEYDDNTVLDAPFMSLDMGSTNGTLVVRGLVRNTVERFEGRLFLYSGVWSNSFIIDTNAFPTTHHFLFIDPEDLLSDKEVTIFESRIRGDNLIIHDRIRTTKQLLLDATNIVLYGGLQPTLEALNVGPAQMPRLINFTNFGTNSLIQGRSEFGMSPAPRMKSWHNSGLFLGFSHRIQSEQIVNRGTLLASRVLLELHGDTIDLRGGMSGSLGDTHLQGRRLFSAGSVLSAGGFLTYTQFVAAAPGGFVLDISDEVNDGGPGLNNLWSVTNGGFRVVRKPAVGDLLGTRITSSATGFREATHTWAGEDRGANPSGFQNNLALQRLTLNGDRFSLFSFAPANPAGGNALYVQHLEFVRGATNVAQNLEVRPGMMIY
ncbi:MAG TPA: hypothetical protein DCY13_11180, partial [Verrucomicrobiales bacterium]|nr:hypothetical protein [Verrucomicrobiales bacterium]